MTKTERINKQVEYQNLRDEWDYVVIHEPEREDEIIEELERVERELNG